MRGYELTESVEDHLVFSLLRKKIKRVAVVLRNFEEVVKAKGYTAASLAAKEVLDNTQVDWLTEYMATLNPKIKLTLAALINVREKLLSKINSGV